MVNYKKVYNLIHNKRTSLSVFEIHNNNFIKSIVPDIPEENLLDLGCGNGHFLSLFKKCHVFGVDVAENCLIYDINNFIVSDITSNLCFENNTFDIVTLNGVFEHFEEDIAVRILGEIFRILKQNGLFISSIPNKFSVIQNAYDLLKENKWIRQFFGRPVYEGQQHIKLYTMPELKRILTLSGFKVEKTVPMNTGIFNLLLAPFAYEGRFYCKSLQPLLSLLLKIDWLISKFIPIFIPVHIQYCYICRK